MELTPSSGETGSCYRLSTTIYTPVDRCYQRHEISDVSLVTVMKRIISPFSRYRSSKHSFTDHVNDAIKLLCPLSLYTVITVYGVMYPAARTS